MDICLFGGAKAGKTSIVKVIFENKTFEDTVTFEESKKMDVTQVKRGLIQFRVFDFPSSKKFKEGQSAEVNRLDSLGALIYVSNLQSDPTYDFHDFIEQTKFIKKLSGKVSLHVFLHKIDIIQEDKRNQMLTDVKKRVNQEIQAEKLVDWKVQYYTTSILDNSIHQAFSKVLQKVIPQIPFLLKGVDLLMQKCKMEKVFLFDLLTKLYLGTDSQPFNSNYFNVCSEMIDVYRDIYLQYSKIKGFDKSDNSKSTISINYGGDLFYLILQEVHKYFAVVGIIKDNNYERPYLIDHNITAFKQTLLGMFEA